MTPAPTLFSSRGGGGTRGAEQTRGPSQGSSHHLSPKPKPGATPPHAWRCEEAQGELWSQDLEAPAPPPASAQPQHRPPRGESRDTTPLCAVGLRAGVWGRGARCWPLPAPHTHFTLLCKHFSLSFLQSVHTYKEVSKIVRFPSASPASSGANSLQNRVQAKHRTPLSLIRAPACSQHPLCAAAAPGVQSPPGAGTPPGAQGSRPGRSPVHPSPLPS